MLPCVKVGPSSTMSTFLPHIAVGSSRVTTEAALTTVAFGASPRAVSVTARMSASAAELVFATTTISAMRRTASPGSPSHAVWRIGKVSRPALRQRSTAVRSPLCFRSPANQRTVCDLPTPVRTAQTVRGLVTHAQRVHKNDLQVGPDERKVVIAAPSQRITSASPSAAIKMRP
jgi:hypothetical protein